MILDGRTIHIVTLSNGKLLAVIEEPDDGQFSDGVSIASTNDRTASFEIDRYICRLNQDGVNVFNCGDAVERLTKGLK